MFINFEYPKTKNMKTAFLKISAFILLFFLVGTGCEKDILNPETSNPETDDITKDFLNEVKFDRLDRSSVYFIRGEFDGKVIYFTTISDAYYYDDTSWSALFVNDKIGLDQINLIRENQENSVQIAIFLQQTKIYSRQFPYNISGTNLMQDGHAEIQLINLKKQYSAVQGSSDDDFTFMGTTFNNSLKIQITRFVDNTLEGTFEGALTSKKGSTIHVKNGSFCIKIKVVNS